MKKVYYVRISTEPVDNFFYYFPKEGTLEAANAFAMQKWRDIQEREKSLIEIVVGVIETPDGVTDPYELVKYINTSSEIFPRGGFDSREPEKAKAV